MSLLKFAVCTIFLVSTYKAKLKVKKEKLGVSVHLSEQWRYEFDLFALKSYFCKICFILLYISLYFIETINVILFYATCQFWAIGQNIQILFKNQGGFSELYKILFESISNNFRAQEKQDL